ncbi:MAG: PAS domain S-box protein, partial [Deltaproteobacteria bacterium]|nr:PAS domain S-box protein [Deltaproteobacteria bacterium]
VRDILGYEPEEMAGRTPFGHMAGEDAARFKEALTEFAASMKPFTFEIRCVSKDGSAAVLETSGAPIIGVNGALLGYRGVDRDVTERKRIEQEKEKMHAQMLQSQKMELMGRLSAGVAHDFNNIMTIITSLNSLALREAGTGPLRDYLDQIQATSERASNLTRQLLIFSRSQPTKAEILDLNRAVDDMLRLLRHILGENILVTSELGTAPVFVQADKSNSGLRWRAT